MSDSSTPTSTPTLDPPLELDAVWDKVIAELSESELSPQHRAWVNLTRPIGLVEDTALLPVSTPTR